MKVYVVNGKEGIGKTDFAVNLAEALQKQGKVLLLQAKRNSRSNIEDYFQKDGMITYDIADYFSKLAPIEKVLVHETTNLDFMISPLMEDKYQFNSADMTILLGELAYDFVVIDGLAKNIVPQSESIEILGMDNIEENFEADAFFINKSTSDYDIRYYKDIIDGKSSRFLGTVKQGEYFGEIINNLTANVPVEIPKVGFFEKLKSGFRK